MVEYLLGLCIRAETQLPTDKSSVTELLQWIKKRGPRLVRFHLVQSPV